MNLEELKTISKQLNQFVDFFKNELRRSERRHWCHMYLLGLMSNGERKSMYEKVGDTPGIRAVLDDVAFLVVITGCKILM